MKKLCSFLKEHTISVFNFRKKKLLPLTNKELKLHQ